jgi:hypothetical protein
MGDSAQTRYLQLLGAPSAKALEDRIVDTLLGAVRERQSCQELPVRLSSVVNKFSIVPKPQLASGGHDGHIDYEKRGERFVITLCTPCPERPLREQPFRTRMRFTYAHEVAHRFFFVSERGTWTRARDVVTSSLPPAEELRQKVTLGRIEESLCNSIARRVLIPDQALHDLDLDDWFREGIGFIHSLTMTAKRFGVSRDCLLVRLQLKPVNSPRFAFLIGKSRGTVLRRGNFGLRVITWLGPKKHAILSERRLHPGIEWTRFGTSACEFVESCLQNDQRFEGAVSVPLETGKGSLQTFRGWWSVLKGRQQEKSRNRVLLWGEFV